MDDWEYLKQVGIEIPKQITLSKMDWKDFYITLSKFKARLMKRHGYHPKDSFHPTSGKLIPYKRTERGA